MKLLPGAARHGCRNGGDREGEAGGAAPDHPHGAKGDEAAAGIEWEDDMVEVNRMTTPANMRWKLVDRESGAENAGVDWRFRVGDQDQDSATR